MRNDSRLLYKQAISLFGEEAQITMAFEEMGEFISALAQIRRGRTRTEQLSDEIADAKIMLEQMEVVFNLEDQVEEVYKFKLERLQQRVDETLARRS